MPQPPSALSRPLSRVAALSAVMVVTLLSVPLPGPRTPPRPEGGEAFRWNRDSMWQGLEAAFVEARQQGCADSDVPAQEMASLEAAVRALDGSLITSVSSSLDSIEDRLFRLAPRVAACPALVGGFVALQVELRTSVKQFSRAWDMTDRTSRDRLYRLLYGSRAAVEEAILQHPDGAPALMLGTDDSSGVPGAVVRGVMIRSGDMLVSRGGYPTSALIARGNDYPGNFSHVALAHVDSATGVVSVIEAHIESGVAVSTAEAYLSDKKLRLMVLRVRSDHPALDADPLLPHRAASAMLARARSEHVPYDFEMDYGDPSRLFCSEVASAAYRNQGIALWAGISTISSDGLRNWLGAFGVTHFQTQEPSDLEYDPQLVVVAEWRDPAMLFKDHIDNAVTDAMLEGAELGDRLTFAWYKLPLARVAKGYSWIKERFGGIGPIPEGMSAAAALRNTAYSTRHGRLSVEVDRLATEWREAHGYPPAYWTLVELARAAMLAETS